MIYTNSSLELMIVKGANKVRPETTYADLRSTDENSGNVVENKSLYWHPTVYEYDSDTGIYKKDNIFYSSAYYIWNTGEARAFPDGFKVMTSPLSLETLLISFQSLLIPHLLFDIRWLQVLTVIPSLVLSLDALMKDLASEATVKLQAPFSLKKHARNWK